jgi:hypothetical protein
MKQYPLTGIRKAMYEYAEENYSDMLKRCPDTVTAEELVNLPTEVTTWYIMNAQDQTVLRWSAHKPLIDLITKVLQGIYQEENYGCYQGE